MTASKGLGTYGDGAGVVTPIDHKMAHAGMVVKTAAAGNAIRTGLFWNGSTTVVSGTAGMSYSVAAYTCVTQRSAAAGAVFGSNDGTLSVATTAAPGSNSRIDIIYHWQREFSLDGVNSDPVIGVVQGTAAAVPAAPSLAAFPGAIEIGRATVSAGATATNGAGVTITQTGRFTAMAGGIVPVRNTTERDAGSWVESQQVYLLDTDTVQTYNGSSWAAVTGTLSLPGGITTTSGYTTKLEKNGNIVTLAFALDNSGVTVTAAIPSGKIIATLPVGFRPTTNAVTVFSGNNNSGAVQLVYTIDTAGVIRAYPAAGLGAGATMFGSTSFSVA